MNLAGIIKQDILSELKQGNTDIIKGLPPVLVLQYAMALQNEAGGYMEKSPIDDNEVAKVVVNRLQDSGVKEILLKQIEKDNIAFAEKVVLAKEISANV